MAVVAGKGGVEGRCLNYLPDRDRVIHGMGDGFGGRSKPDARNPKPAADGHGIRAEGPAVNTGLSAEQRLIGPRGGEVTIRWTELYGSIPSERLS